jgi:hypothetical protein
MLSTVALEWDFSVDASRYLAKSGSSLEKSGSYGAKRPHRPCTTMEGHTDIQIYCDGEIREVAIESKRVLKVKSFTSKCMYLNTRP